MPEKPEKPYPNFPLFAHASGQWCKTFRTKTYYFGPWADWQGALERYEQDLPYISRGLVPPRRIKCLSVEDLADEFLAGKQEDADHGHLSATTVRLYQRAIDQAVRIIGPARKGIDVKDSDIKRVYDAFARKYGPVSLGPELTRLRSWLTWCIDSQQFAAVDLKLLRKPKKITVRKHLAKRRHDFDAHEIRQLIDHANPRLRAMILLGINCGFGPGDCASLEWRHVDHVAGFANFPRPKTGIPRRAALWSVTIAALCDQPDNSLGRVFATKYGNTFDEGRNTSLSLVFRRLMVARGIHQPNRGFYGLRHTFATVASECQDQVAVDHVMGHATSSVAAGYRHRVSDDRLRLVAQTVHRWLFSRDDSPIIAD